MTRSGRVASVVAVGIAALSGVAMLAGRRGAEPSHAARVEAAAPAVVALRSGRFDAAARATDQTLAADPGNAMAAAVRAIARYTSAADAAAATLRAGADPAAQDPIEGMRRARTAFETLDARLVEVIADLDVAAGDAAFELELCPGCWQRDWNGDDRIDDRDRRLMEVELGRDGKPLPEGDPRRRPTFRLDAGDVRWALAMVKFQRAGLQLVLGYRWELAWGGLGQRSSSGHRFFVPLHEPERIQAVRQLVLDGIRDARAARDAYLAETDDDREWVPNPRQKSHAVPLEVDARLYEKWGATLRDVEQLLRGTEGLKVLDLAGIDRDRTPDPPAGYIDPSRLFTHPRDIDIDVAKIRQLDTKTKEGVEALLDLLFGDAYVDEMAASPLPARLARLREEIARGDEVFGTKLRYLLWLN